MPGRWPPGMGVAAWAGPGSSGVWPWVGQNSGRAWLLPPGGGAPPPSCPAAPSGAEPGRLLAGRGPLVAAAAALRDGLRVVHSVVVEAVSAAEAASAAAAAVGSGAAANAAGYQAGDLWVVGESAAPVAFSSVACPVLVVAAEVAGTSGSSSFRHEACQGRQCPSDLGSCRAAHWHLPWAKASVDRCPSGGWVCSCLHCLGGRKPAVVGTP